MEDIPTFYNKNNFLHTGASSQQQNLNTGGSNLATNDYRDIQLQTQEGNDVQNQQDIDEPQSGYRSVDNNVASDSPNPYATQTKKSVSFSPSPFASPPDLETAQKIHEKVEQHTQEQSKLYNEPTLNLDNQTSDQIESEPLYKNKSAGRFGSQELFSLKAPAEKIHSKSRNNLVSDIPTQNYLKTEKLETQESRSTDSSGDQKGVFYPNPIDDYEDAKLPKKLYKGKFSINADNLILFLLYLGAIAFYLVVRVKFSLFLGNYVAYGWIMIVIEAMGAFSVLNFGFLAIFKALGNRIKWNPGDQLMRTERKYHIRVLIPCYKENLEIVSHTVMACYYAPVPLNCKKTIYVLDDGNDPGKEKWVQSVNSDNMVYLNGRQKQYVQMKDRKGRPIMKSDGTPLLQYGEVNGKAENINNALKNYIYKDLKPEDIPLNEMICIMDADQVACRAFFMRMVPLLDGGDNLGMVFSPQCFYNTPPYSDIFNHSNIHFWEYILPGADALNVLFCPGSNVLIRSQALCQANWFPTNSVTEDFVLGMKFTANGWRYRYVKEYLAVGEAPDTLAQCLQQKSRWCKGHFQIIFNYYDSPMTIRGLNPLQRLVYLIALYNYIANVLNMVFFFLVPVIAIWFGVFPLIIDFWVALGMTVYYFNLLLIKYYTRHPSLWFQIAFANIANFTLSFTYMKAIFNGSWASFTGRLKTFKATEKKDTSKKASSHQRAQFFETLRLIWPFWILFYVQLISLIFALIWLAILYHTEVRVSLSMTLAGAPTELALSIVWIFYNFMPYYLVIHYTYFGTGFNLNVACFVTMAVQILAYGGVILVVWLLMAVIYPYGQLLDDSIYFLETQKAGYLNNATVTNRVPWRSDSTLYDGNDIGIDLTGGLYAAGNYGFLKATLPIAYITTMLAWGLTRYESSYQKADAYNNALNQLQWNLQYLSKTVVLGSQQEPYAIVMQVGKRSSENSYWARPEDEDQSRPVYSYIGAEGGADVAAQLTATFASAYKLYQTTQPGIANVQAQQALATYQYMKAIQNAPLYDYKNTNTGNLAYMQDTKYDDFMWAAAWMFEAFGDPQYLDDFFNFRNQYLNKELNAEAFHFTWDFVYWGAETLLQVHPTASKLRNFDDVNKELDYMWSKQLCEHYDQYILGGQQHLNDTQSNWNPQYPRKLGTLANHAFLGLIKSESTSIRNDQAITYYCWSEVTIRAFLGENVLSRNFVGGITVANKVNHKRFWERASSCGPSPEVCNRLNNYYNQNPNPHELKGALPFQFGMYDDRTNPSNMVSIENNVGYTNALAGLINTKFAWNQCWRIQSLRFRKNPVCHSYGWVILQNGQNG